MGIEGLIGNVAGGASKVRPKHVCFVFYICVAPQRRHGSHRVLWLTIAQGQDSLRRAWKTVKKKKKKSHFLKSAAPATDPLNLYVRSGVLNAFPSLSLRVASIYQSP